MYVLYLSTAVTPFNPDSPFDMRALSLLEAAAGIPVMRTLKKYTQQIQNILGFVKIPDFGLKTLLNFWLRNAKHILPTWKNLLLVIRLLNLDELAERIETYLSAGATEDLELGYEDEESLLSEGEEGEGKC